MSRYNLFTEVSDSFSPVNVDGSHKDLPSGAYEPWYDAMRDKVYFDKIKLETDKIIDLPSKEYEYVTTQMQHFLKPATQDKYKDNGFVYKRSVMLHGKPGTGKTVIVNRVTQEALKQGAVVLFNPEPAYMTKYFKALEDTNPSKLTLVIFEEMEELLKRPGNETLLLSILDGEVQKNNIIYLGTTNFIDQIPLRFQRPGRFSSIVEVGFPSAKAREVYLTHKRVNTDMLKGWVEKTEGFSVDELKETVLAVKCLDETLDSVVTRIKELKNRGMQGEVDKGNNNEYDDEDFDDLGFKSGTAKSYAKSNTAYKERMNIPR